MKFYRRLKPFKAISFDLDDTLYQNTPVMEKTEAQMLSFFHHLLRDHSLAKTTQFDFSFWLPFRYKALASNPELIHGVAEIRKAGYVEGLQALGFTFDEANLHADQALKLFDKWRSNFSVPQSSHQLLTTLQNHLPIVSISNGNVKTDVIGISQYFSAIYHPGNGVKQKPHSDMFNQACQQLNIAPHELLHVGDCGHSDIFGAVNAGCQTAWLSCYDVGKPLSVLPNVELTNVCDLLNLVVEQKT